MSSSRLIVTKMSTNMARATLDHREVMGDDAVDDVAAESGDRVDALDDERAAEQSAEEEAEHRHRRDRSVLERVTSRRSDVSAPFAHIARTYLLSIASAIAARSWRAMAAARPSDGSERGRKIRRASRQASR